MKGDAGELSSGKRYEMQGERSIELTSSSVDPAGAPARVKVDNFSGPSIRSNCYVTGNTSGRREKLGGKKRKNNKEGKKKEIRGCLKMARRSVFLDQGVESGRSKSLENWSTNNSATVSRNGSVLHKVLLNATSIFSVLTLAKWFTVINSVGILILPLCL